MIDSANFTTAFVIFGVVLAALIAAGVALAVSYARRESEAAAAVETPVTASAAERQEELVG
ncbi:MAG TPA: hypothetical protein VGL93_32705 [Streptosporangiaceae bacterium]|jgi:hypothetical protein